MKARPIRSRADLLELAAQYAPTKACATALSERRVTVLGGFTPTGGHPCWIVEVTSARGRRWIIAVECNEDEYKFKVKYLEAVPWEYWIGQSTGRNPLIDGDDPVGSALQRCDAEFRKLNGN